MQGVEEIKVTAFDWVPSFAQGHVRDLRVRWALEEAGLPYQALIIEQGTQTGADNLARQPFGQVPAIDLDGFTMFESGAIVWRITEASEALCPVDPRTRDRVLTWLFAALNTMEPRVAALVEIDIFMTDEELKTKLRPSAIAALKIRLDQLSSALGAAGYLVADRFTAADLIMTTVLRDIGDGVLREYPSLEAYVARHTARDGFAKALSDQLKTFAEHAARYERAA